MKLTSTGYRVTKNGSIMKSIEKDALQKITFEGQSIKENGTYYFFNRKQGDTFVYLP